MGINIYMYKMEELIRRSLIEVLSVIKFNDLRVV